MEEKSGKCLQRMKKNGRATIKKCVNALDTLAVRVKNTPVRVCVQISDDGDVRPLDGKLTVLQVWEMTPWEGRNLYLWTSDVEFRRSKTKEQPRITKFFRYVDDRPATQSQI